MTELAAHFPCDVNSGGGLVLLAFSRACGIELGEHGFHLDSATAWRSRNGLHDVLQFVGDDFDRGITTQARFHQHAKHGHLAEANRPE